jgi:hypothetical protein
MKRLNSGRDVTGSFLFKEMAGGHSFELSERIADTEYRTFLKPDLLTNLFNPTVTPHDGTTFLWDVVTKTVQRVGGKSYSEDGPSLTKNVATQKAAGIPAFGVTYEIAAEDVIRRRKAGAYPSVKEAIADLMGEQGEKMMDAYDILNEEAMVQLIVDDTNITLGGPSTPYNWSTTIEGSSRDAATDLLLGSATPESVRDAINDAIDKGNERLKKRGKRASAWIGISGKTIFNSLVDVEAALGADYDVRPTLNLKVEPIPTMMVSEHRYRNFTSSMTGVTFVQYQAQMIAADGPLIDTDKMYLVPVGVENMFTIELAPDVTLDNAGELALPMYMYYEQDRHQVRVASATNRLYMNRVPNAIIAFTSST